MFSATPGNFFDARSTQRVYLPYFFQTIKAFSFLDRVTIISFFQVLKRAVRRHCQIFRNEIWGRLQAMGMFGQKARKRFGGRMLLRKKVIVSQGSEPVHRFRHRRFEHLFVLNWGQKWRNESWQRGKPWKTNKRFSSIINLEYKFYKTCCIQMIFGKAI